MEAPSNYPAEFEFGPNWSDTIQTIDGEKTVTWYAHLLGIEEGEPVYWDAYNNQIIRPSPDFNPPADARKPELNDHHREYPEYTIHEYEHRDAETVDEYVLHSERKHGWRHTDLGDFLRRAAPFNGTRLLSPRETEVYALRKYTSAGRPATACVLGISVNTVDVHYGNAKNKIESMVSIAKFVRD